MQRVSGRLWRNLNFFSSIPSPSPFLPPPPLSLTMTSYSSSIPSLPRVKVRRRDDKTYEDTINHLCSMQSNASILAQWKKEVKEKRDSPICPPFPPPTSSSSKLKGFMDALAYIGVDTSSQSPLSIVHVTGTKGKGSTCAFVESILREYGYKTGLFTSPHLVKANERFRINGKEISDEVFIDYFWATHDALYSPTSSPPHPPPLPFFSFLSLMGLVLFVGEGVEVVVLEVGVGGRGDCTNVFAEPKVAGVALLDYDHQSVLGETIEEIAWQKAGIFKENVPAFIVPQVPSAVEVFKNEAQTVKTPYLRVVKPLERTLLEGKLMGIEGDHQLTNASLAIHCAHTWLKSSGVDSGLKKQSTKIEKEEGGEAGEEMDMSEVEIVGPLPEKMVEGLRKTKWPGRSHVARSGRLGDCVFYFDGAHTEKSIEACMEWFGAVSFSSSSLPPYTILCFGCSSDREPAQLLAPIKENADKLQIQKTIFTTTVFNQNQPNLSKVRTQEDTKKDQKNLDTMENFWKEGRKGEGEDCVKCLDVTGAAEEIKRIKEGLEEGRELRVFVTGSFYVIGGIMTHFPLDD